MQNYDATRGTLTSFVLQVATSVALDFKRLQGRRLRTDASTEEKELQTVSPAEALPIDLASDRLREELAPPKEEAEKLVFEDLWAGLRISEIVRKTYI